MTNSSCPKGEGFNRGFARAIVTKVVVKDSDWGSQGQMIGAGVFVGDSSIAFSQTQRQCGDTLQSTYDRGIYTFVCDVPGQYLFVSCTSCIINTKQIDVYIDGGLFEGGTADQSSILTSDSTYNTRGPAIYARDGLDKTPHSVICFR